MLKVESINRFLNIQNRMETLISDDENDRSILPQKIGVSKATFSKIANYGIIPKVKSLIRIADYFEISLDYLVCRTNDKSFFPSIQSNTFYDRIELLKNERGYKNISQLATATCLPRQYFFDWQKKQILPNIEILEDLANFFKVSLDYLLGRSDIISYSDTN